MLHIASSLVLLIVATGLYFRHRRRLHMKLMTCAFLIDLSLVVYIEISRHAVEKVSTGVRPLVYFHAFISLSVLVNYVLMIYLGKRVLAGHRGTRTTHRNLGITFVVLRSLNYVTALIM